MTSQDATPAGTAEIVEVAEIAEIADENDVHDTAGAADDTTGTVGALGTTASVPPGAWPSPISAADAVAAGRSLEGVAVAGTQVWWSESRPEENGRTVVCRADPAHSPATDPPADTGENPDTGSGTDVDSDRAPVAPAVADLLPAPWNTRSRVHEYGGRSWLPVPGADGHWDLVFVEFTDQRLYRLDPDHPDRPPVPLTPAPAAPAALRYVDLSLDPVRGRLLAVREEHLPEPDQDAHTDENRDPEDDEAPRGIRRTVVGVPLDGRGAVDPDLIEDILRDVPSSDFLAGPRVDPTGAHLLWTSWDHPAMPWDSTVLHLAGMGAGGRATGARELAGGPGVSIIDADFVPARDGRVLIVAQSDATGWWQPHLLDPHAGTMTPLSAERTEFAVPPWTTGWRSWVRRPSGELVVTPGGRPALLPLSSATPVPLHPGWTECLDLAAGPDGPVAAVVAADREPTAVVTLDPDGGHTVLRRATDMTPDRGYLPEPRARTVQGVHIVVYPPTHPDHVAAPGTSPAIVLVHGGPTSAHARVLSLRTAYFTSRGFTVVGLDHRGSTGYGRAYRDALRGNWARLDIEDAITVGRALLADGTAGSVVISGGSAGGLTVLGTLTTAGQPFAAGTSSYGIGDLVALAEDTHDFESRYLESLLGNDPQVWRERSPITRAGELATPVLLLQGGLDPVVPPAQAEAFAAVCRARGVPHALVIFPEESHGFRAGPARIAALEAELSFSGQILGFDPPGVPALPLLGGPSGQAQ